MVPDAPNRPPVAVPRPVAAEEDAVLGLALAVLAAPPAGGADVAEAGEAGLLLLPPSNRMAAEVARREGEATPAAREALMMAWATAAGPEYADDAAVGLLPALPEDSSSDAEMAAGVGGEGGTAWANLTRGRGKQMDAVPKASCRSSAKER